jgi:hypothetical protein
LIKKRSFWIAVFIMGAFLFGMPFFGGSSTLPVSSQETIEAPVEKIPPTYQPPIPTSTSPTPHSVDNVTIYVGSIVSGTWNNDGDSLIDWFYINVTIDVLVPGPYFAVATLNYSYYAIDPGADPDDDIPAVYAFDWAMYSLPGGDGPGATFGETTGNTTRTLAFRGDHINATGVQDQPLKVTSIAVADVTLINQPGENPVIGQAGTFPMPGTGTPWWSSTAIYTTPTTYNANQFERWEYAYVYEGEWSDSTWNPDGGPVEYLVLEAKVNASADMRVRFEAELEDDYWSENTTNLVKGNQTIQLYYRSPNIPVIPGPGGYDVNRYQLQKWSTLFGAHWEDMDDSEVEGGDPPIYTTTVGTTATTWEHDQPGMTIVQSTSGWSLTLVDGPDSGTLYDQLQVTVQVNVDAWGLYSLYAKWGGQDEGLAIEAHEVMWLGEGTNQDVVLNFDSGLIGSLTQINRLHPPPDYTAGPWNLSMFDYLEITALNQRWEEYDRWGEIYNHGDVSQGTAFDPIAFIDPSTTFTDSVQMLYGDPLFYWMNITTTFDEVLEVDLDYPWYDDYMYGGRSPFYFQVFLIDINWTAMGGEPAGFAEYLQEPASLYYAVNQFSKGPHRWIRVSIDNILHEDPLIPQYLALDLTINSFDDDVAPTTSLTKPTSGVSVSDEFGFGIDGDVSDDEAVWRVDVFLSGFTAPIASSDPEYWYRQPTWNGPDNITAFWPADDGTVSLYAYPKDHWVGSRTLTMRATDYGMNTAEAAVSITIRDDPEPVPDDLILNGLNWIVSRQQSDGSYLWARQDQRGHDDPPASTPSFTAWAMLALLQNGSRWDDPVVQACWNYIASQVQSDGGIYSLEVRQPNYETAIALMGLIPLAISYEAHSQSNTTLDNAITGAVDFLISIQNTEQWKYDPSDIYYGGWGYGYPNEEKERGGWADLSNTQWTIIALAAARDFGITAAENDTVWQRAEGYVRRCYVESTFWNGTHDVTEGGFAYQPPGGESFGGAMETMTAAGIWCLALMGYDEADSDIAEALMWMENHWGNYVRENFDGGGYQYYALFSAAKALLLTGHAENASRYGWMYEDVYRFLREHTIWHSGTEWFWDNMAGSEGPIMATLEAVLSQQIAFGKLGEVDHLSVTAECQVHLHVFGPNGTHYGYNYKTGQIETAGGSTYSGLDSYPQQIIIQAPEKGIYTISIIPLEAGDVNITVMGKTVAGDTIAIRDLEITSVVPGTEYVANITLTTLYGVNFFAEPFTQLPPGEASLALADYIVGDIDYLDSPDSLEINPGNSFTIEMMVTLDNGPFARNAIATAYVYSSDITLNRVSHDLGDVSGDSPAFEWTVTVSATAVNRNHTIWISIVAKNIGVPMIIPCVFYVDSSYVPEGYSIEVTQPNGGEELSGSYMIKWNAVAPEGATMSFKVEYSSNGGANWVLLASGVIVQQYEWDTTDVEDGDNYLVRVTFLEVSLSDTSDGSFSIKQEDEERDAISPGFELLIALFSMVAAAALIRRTRRH